jgi:hypothetical protein
MLTTVALSGKAGTVCTAVAVADVAVGVTVGVGELAEPGLALECRRVASVPKISALNSTTAAVASIAG